MGRCYLRKGRAARGRSGTRVHGEGRQPEGRQEGELRVGWRNVQGREVAIYPASGGQAAVSKVGRGALQRRAWWI